jgi:hypothetical protein
VNCVNNVSITKNAHTILGITQASWSCSAMSTPTGAEEVSAPVSTTATVARVGQQVLCLKPSDPYPTWPFTQVEPKSLARWCKKNVNALHNIEEAPF